MTATKTLDTTTEGNGDTIVLVHGSASDRRTWDAVRPTLARDHRVVTYSRRYHWPNPSIPENADYSMTEHVDDLIALLRSLEAGPTHLIGHSYGGVLALMAAIGEPSLVRTMVLIEPPVVALFLSSPPRPTELLRTIVTRPRIGIALARFGMTGLQPAVRAAERGEMDEALQVFGNAVLGKAAWGSLSVARLEQARANNIRAEYTGSGFAPLAADHVRQVIAPSLIVSGGDSPTIWRLLADHLHRLLPRSVRVEIEGASHIVHEDQTDEFNQAVLTFLAGNR